MEKKFSWGSFCAGMCTAMLICITIYAVALHPKEATNPATDVSKNESSTTGETETETEKEKSYDTIITSKTVELNSGETFTFYTPSGYFSLTDQYLDSIGDYYDVDVLKSDTMFVVGDNKDQTLADTIINVDIMSDLPNVFSQLYGKTYTAEEVDKSTTYKYMTTGEIPEDAEDNYKVNEIDDFEVNGIKFKTFAVSYSNTYQDEDGNDQVLETKEIDCYSSNTDDPIEIVMYQTKYDEDAAVKLIREFCGVSE